MMPNAENPLSLPHFQVLQPNKRLAMPGHKMGKGMTIKPVSALPIRGQEHDKKAAEAAANAALGGLVGVNLLALPLLLWVR